MEEEIHIEKKKSPVSLRILKFFLKVISVTILFLLKHLWEVLEPIFGWLVNIIKKQVKKHPAGASSLTLHLMLLLLIVIGLPDMLREKPEEFHFIPVEMLPIKDITNAKPQEVKEEVKEIKKEEPKEPPKKVYTKPAPAEPEQKEVVKLDDKPKEKAEVKEKPKPKPAEKKPKEITEKKKETDKKKIDEDFESVLRSVEKMKEIAPQKKTVAAPAPYDPGKPLSMSEKDSIKRQIEECWSVPAGARDAEDIIVVLKISLAQDGTATSVKILEQSRYGTDNFFRAAADSAMRAVYKCSPLKGLPQDKYSSWREMELSFNPKDIL